MNTDNSPPPKSIDSEYIIARQFYLTSEGVVWYSKIGNHEAVPPSNYIPILTEGGDAPKRIISHFGGLLVFFEQSIWYIDLQSADPIYWVPRKLNADFGSPYMFSIVKGKLPNQQVGIFYLAEDKSVRVLTGVGSDQVQLFDNIYTDRLSMPIEVSLKLDDTDPDDIYMTFFDYKLYVSLDNNLFIWDSQMGGEWTKYDLPVQQKYVGAVDNSLAFSNADDIYYLTSGEDLNILTNEDFRVGFYDWNTSEEVGAIENGFSYDGGTAYRTVIIPDNGTYFLNYTVSPDDVAYAQTGLDDYAIPVEGGTIHHVYTPLYTAYTEATTVVLEVVDTFNVSFGDKPLIMEPLTPGYTQLYSGWNILSVVPEVSLSASSVITYLESYLGAGNVEDFYYFDDRELTNYDVSGDGIVNYGEMYYFQTGTTDAYIFSGYYEEAVTIDFVTGDNYIACPIKQYRGVEYLEELGSGAYSIGYYSGGNSGTVETDTAGSTLGQSFLCGKGTYLNNRGLKVNATKSFSYKVQPYSGTITDLSIFAPDNDEVYTDVLQNLSFAENSSFEENLDGWTFVVQSGSDQPTVDNGDCILYSGDSFNAYTFSSISQSVTLEQDLPVGVTYIYEIVTGKIAPFGTDSWLQASDGSTRTTVVVTSNPGYIDVGIQLRHDYVYPGTEIGELKIKSITVKYEDSQLPVVWNYTTQVFADKYELYSDFDKLWIRGNQESDAPIVISFNCNGNDSSYSDYVNATLTGDATINTDEHGLLGAGGRDIQLNISGEDYIRVDDLSIRRSTRED